MIQKVSIQMRFELESLIIKDFQRSGILQKKGNCLLFYPDDFTGIGLFGVNFFHMLRVRYN